VTTPDPTPYLLATDLRTADDALAFVRIYVLDPALEWDLSDVYNYLERRLDRERRQACRRASFVNLPELARLQRKRKFAVKRLWDYAVEDIDSLRRGHIARALAFRAAARAK
jgi:hypothetical protein